MYEILLLFQARAFVFLSRFLLPVTVVLNTLCPSIYHLLKPLHLQYKHCKHLVLSSGFILYNIDK